VQLRKRSPRIVGVLAIAAIVAGVAVAFARAGQPVVTFGITLSPKPVVTAGQQTLAIAKFKNVGGNSLNNVVFTIPLPAGSGFVALSSSGCSPDSVGTTVTCLIGHVAAGDGATRYIVFTAPLSGSLTVSGTVTWDEALGNNVHQDTTSASDSTTLVSTTSPNATGACSTGAGTLRTVAATSSSGNQVGTSVAFSANNQGLPCTPVSVQDDVPVTVPNVTCTASPCVGALTTLPQLPGPATVTITFDGSLFPPPGSGPNPNKFVVYETLDPTATVGEAVPLCSTNPNHYTTYGTCEVGAAKYGTRGIQVTLQVPGRGIDPAWYG